MWKIVKLRKIINVKINLFCENFEMKYFEFIFISLLELRWLIVIINLFIQRLNSEHIEQHWDDFLSYIINNSTFVNY